MKVVCNHFLFCKEEFVMCPHVKPHERVRGSFDPCKPTFCSWNDYGVREVNCTVWFVPLAYVYWMAIRLYWRMRGVYAR